MYIKDNESGRGDTDCVCANWVGDIWGIGIAISLRRIMAKKFSSFFERAMGDWLPEKSELGRQVALPTSKRANACNLKSFVCEGW